MTGDSERDDIDPSGEAPPNVSRPELSIDPDLDFDAAFAALVAQFSAPDAPLPAGSTGSAGLPAAQRPPATVGGPSTEPLYPAELDEHFEPPEPPPLPRGDLYSRLAWSGVIGGPTVLLIAAFVGGDLPSYAIVLALAAFVGGFVTLVARMPGDRPDDSDDGAVV
ncbi:MAG: hypothetical protein U0Q19_04495 [Kineosporiaceae bacterium]